MRPERVAYLATAAATTVAGALDLHQVHALTKASMVPALQGTVLRRWSALDSGARVGLIGATAAALVGDVLLVAPADGESEGESRRRLRRGASAFAVQQLGYLWLLRGQGVRPRRRSVIPVGVILAGLAALDTAKQSAPDPVVTGYGLLLGAMSAHALEASDPRIRWGGAAFLASDAMILVREQLLRDRPGAERAAQAFVLSTYALAQRWLVDGLVAGARR